MKMKCYKLTDENDRTSNNTQWGENISHEVKGNLKLCGNGYHAFKTPIDAFSFCYPLIHANWRTAHLWEAIGENECIEDRIKICFRKLTTIKRIEKITNKYVEEHWIELSILNREYICASNILSTDFIEEHWPKFDKNQRSLICRYQHLPLSFIEKHWAMLTNQERDIVCAYQTLLADFVEEHWVEFTNTQQNAIFLYHKEVYNEWLENRRKNMEKFKEERRNET